MFEVRLEAALRVLEQTGIRCLNYAPPIYRVLWVRAVPIPPPHFRSFRQNFAFMAVGFGLLSGVFSWFVWFELWRGPLPAYQAVLAAVPQAR